MSDVVIVKTGCANLASVISAFEGLGARVTLADTVADIVKAPRLVLPGVGTFGAAMDFWRDRQLCEPIVQHIAQDKPVLAICLGLQLLCKESEESLGVSGLGVVHKSVVRFASDLCVPQMGWNFAATGGRPWFQNGYYYFANSFYLGEPPEAAEFASSSYGDDFVAAFKMGNLLACQFHPELSGQLGLELMRKWLLGESC